MDCSSNFGWCQIVQPTFQYQSSQSDYKFAADKRARSPSDGLVSIFDECIQSKRAATLNNVAPAFHQREGANPSHTKPVFSSSSCFFPSLSNHCCAHFFMSTSMAFFSAPHLATSLRFDIFRREFDPLFSDSSAVAFLPFPSALPRHSKIHGRRVSTSGK